MTRSSSSPAQKKIDGIIMSSPRQVPVFLAEALRPSQTLTCGQDILQSLTRNNRGEAHFRVMFADEVKGHMELYERLRGSLTYLSSS